MNKAPTQNMIAYRWALTAMGYPVPISQARRGERYSCPLCHGPMIPRLGDQLQHHFAHEEDTGCTTEAVTRAAVRRWITIQLRDAIASRQGARPRWTCSKCGQQHSADLLEGVAVIHEGYYWDPTHYADVGLVDRAGNVCGVIVVQDELLPTPETLHFFLNQDTFTIVIPASVEPAGSDFATLVAQGQIAGAPCPNLQKQANIIRDPEAIRQALRDVVARWPAYFYGPLETVEGLANVLRIGNHALWLPPDQWREVIGGTRNPLAPGVQVTMQEWKHDDGGAIWLYYVTVRDTCAVGVRRFGPGQAQMQMPTIDHRFRQHKTTALDVVKSLVMQ